MTLQTFLCHNKIRLLPEIAASCYYAIALMRQSDDQIHDHTHIESILGSLSEFMSQSQEVNWKSIDYNSLILAICWHDVWKSERRTTSPHKIIYHQIYEGLGSMRLFGKHAKVYNLPKDMVKKAKYAIRKHSIFQIIPTRQTEAKILRDMDFLDVWKSIRLKKSITTFTEIGHLTPRFISLLKLYLRFWMQPKAKHTYFDWTKRKIEHEKIDFFDHLSTLPQSFIHQPVNV